MCAARAAVNGSQLAARCFYQRAKPFGMDGVFGHSHPAEHQLFPIVDDCRHADRLNGIFNNMDIAVVRTNSRRKYRRAAGHHIGGLYHGYIKRKIGCMGKQILGHIKHHPFARFFGALHGSEFQPVKRLKKNDGIKVGKAGFIVDHFRSEAGFLQLLMHLQGADSVSRKIRVDVMAIPGQGILIALVRINTRPEVATII